MRRLEAVLVAMVLVTAACGGSSGQEGIADPGGPTTEAPQQSTSEDTAAPTTTTPQVDTTQGVTGNGGESPAVAGEAGIFNVNETEYVVTLLNRCIPFSDSPGNIDLQALAQGEGAKLNLVLMGGTTEVSVDGSGIEEKFGSIAFGQDPVVGFSEVASDRWMGSATVADSLGTGESVNLTWDVMVPAEAHDCGL